MKKKIIAALVLLGLMLQPMAAYADAAVGDQIVTIGTNLNEQQRQEVLSYFNAGENAQIISVDISEERQYLSGKVPEAQIGNSTNSCAMITYTTKGSGVNVTTHNINYVTADAYKSAILTAGINDADVQITALIEVSGTGALTGIMKAYETSTGETISEDVKQAATQELVTNTEIAQDIGDDKANDLINTIKQEIAENKPQNEAEARSLLDQVLSELGITLTDEQYQKLLDLITQFSELDIDWNSVADNVSGLISKASNYLSSDEGQSFLAKLQSLINSFFDWVRDFFSSSGDSDSGTQTTEQTQSNVSDTTGTEQTQTTTDTSSGEASQDYSNTTTNAADTTNTDSGYTEQSTEQNTEQAPADSSANDSTSENTDTAAA